MAPEVDGGSNDALPEVVEPQPFTISATLEDSKDGEPSWPKSVRRQVVKLPGVVMACDIERDSDRGSKESGETPTPRLSQTHSRAHDADGRKVITSRILCQWSTRDEVRNFFNRGERFGT